MRDLFCFLSRRCFEWFIPCWATVLYTEPLLKATLSILCHLSQIVPLWLQNQSRVPVCLSDKVYQSVGQILFAFTFKHHSNNCSNLSYSGHKTGCAVVSSGIFLGSIFYIYILGLILFCLNMLPVGSIKKQLEKKSIYPSPSDHTQLCSPLISGDPCCFKSPLLRTLHAVFLKSFLKQNKSKRFSSVATKTPAVFYPTF